MLNCLIVHLDNNQQFNNLTQTHQFEHSAWYFNDSTNKQSTIQQLMSCFVVPLAQAVVTSAIRKSNEKNNRSNHSAFARHLPALEKMLWGGSVMLVLDHIINGELTWRFPFFTALENAGGGAVMLREMLTVGVPMSLTITAIWAVYAFLKERKKAPVAQ